MACTVSPSWRATPSCPLALSWPWFVALGCRLRHFSTFRRTRSATLIFAAFAETFSLTVADESIVYSAHPSSNDTWRSTPLACRSLPFSAPAIVSSASSNPRPASLIFRSRSNSLLRQSASTVKSCSMLLKLILILASHDHQLLFQAPAPVPPLKYLLLPVTWTEVVWTWDRLGQSLFKTPESPPPPPAPAAVCATWLAPEAVAMRAQVLLLLLSLKLHSTPTDTGATLALGK